MAQAASAVEEFFAQNDYTAKRLLLIVPDNTRSGPVGDIFKMIFDCVGAKATALDVLVALGRPEEAIPILERALALRETTPDVHSEIAESRFALARALWIAKADRARSLRLAKRARDAYAAIGDGMEEELAEVKAWLAERR